MKTKQISDFLSWSGRRGCLFYVSQDPESGRKGGIFLIDSLCRMSDKPSEYDTLHRAELNALNNDNVILSGAMGELFFFCATTKKYRWNEWINQIWIPKPTSLDTKQRIKILVEECRNWLHADKQILNAYPDKEVPRFVEQSFRRAAETILKSIVNETNDLVWKVHTRLPFEHKLSFASHFLNYMIIRNACEYILANAPNNEQLAEMIVDYFSGDGHGFPLDKVIFKINRTDFDKACQYYIERILNTRPCETDLQIIALMGTPSEEQRKEQEWMIEQEFKQYKSEKYTNFGLLPDPVVKALTFAQYGFFQYCFKHFDFEETDKDTYQKNINDLIPDFSQKTDSEKHGTDNVSDSNYPLMTNKHTEHECIKNVKLAITMHKKKSDKCRALKKLDGEYINFQAMYNNEERAEFFNRFIPDGEKKITASDISKALASFPKR